MRVLAVGGIPSWCEIVDADPDLGWIHALLTRSAPPVLAERGRGLALVRELSQGHCRAYPTVITTYAAPGKAVGFALPIRSGTRLTCPSPLDLGRCSLGSSVAALTGLSREKIDRLGGVGEWED